MAIERLTKEQAKAEIKGIIDNFKANYQQHKKELEANTETKLVEPLFEALGWTKDDFVKREKTYRGKKTGYGDYAFKIGDKIVFFLEVKRLGISLEKEADKQVISYALSKRVPFAVSTNFEELNIFCVEQENALHNKFRVFRSPDDYINNFDDFFFLSKESFEQNLILKKAEDEGRLKRRASIDKILLEDLMLIRKLISNDIEKRYPDKYQINEKDEIVQRILNRLIFIRSCEDKGINPEDVLIEEIKHLPHNKCYPKLKGIFEKYNEVYNSGLFAIAKDNDCDLINIDGEIIQKLAYYLYESKDQEYIYDFDWIDADVLGQIYEQYLGKILSQTKSGRSKLKDGQAHRKEQGIYYTPTYIVDYIVKNTLGELLKEKKIKSSEIKILDLACGSGSFLIKAFDYLAGKLGATEEAKQQRIDSQGNYSVKTQILKSNIYGVDLDNKAVEITKLNLLLKAAEKNRKLPEELDLHVRHGNSLIDDEAIAGLTAFKWAGDFAEGSFDIVIGNPPYIRSRNLLNQDRSYFSKNYASAFRTFDIYLFFLEKSIALLKKGGYFGFIIPYSFLNQPYATKLRKIILDSCQIVEIVDLSEFKVFQDAEVRNCIVICRHTKSNKEAVKSSFVNGQIKKIETIDTKLFLKNSDFMYKLEITKENRPLLMKIQQNTIPLNHICYVSKGVEVYERDSGKKKDEFIKNENQDGKKKKYLEAKETGRYSLLWRRRYLDYQPAKHCSAKFPELFENNKIIMKRILGKTGISATFDSQSFYVENTLICVLPKFELINAVNFSSEEIEESKKFDLRFILGILNSKLMSYYFKTKLGDKLQIYNRAIEELPISTSKHNSEFLIKLVDRMLSLNKRLSELGDKNTSESAKIKAEAEKTDAEIDEEVYKLYGITEEEKKIIEESLK